MLKLKRFSEPVICEYSDAKFHIRALTPKAFLDIREKAKRRQFVKDSEGKDVLTNDPDEALLSWMIFEYVLVSYEGIDTEGRTEFEVREDIFNDQILRDWIMERANLIFKTQDKTLGDEIKNSTTLQSVS